MSAPTEAFIFWQNDVPQTIPNNLWTPLILNLNRVSRTPAAPVQGSGESARFEWSGRIFRPVSTTIAAGSDAQALPQATINVADTSAFTSAGWLAIRIGGTDRLVKYTGKTATTFTGGTLGVGTMNTGNLVRQANVEFKAPHPALCVATAEVAFVANATGQRGIRFNFNLLGLTGGSTLVNAAAAGQTNIQTTEQPAYGPNDSSDYIEVFQNSTGNLDTIASGNLDAPRLVASTITSYTGA